MKNFKLHLKLFDRINITAAGNEAQILPQTAKYETGVVARDIREKLKITQADIDRVELKTEGIDHERFRRRLEVLNPSIMLRAVGGKSLLDEILEIAKECFPDSGRSSMRWNPFKDKTVPFTMSEMEYNLVWENLKRLDKAEKIPADQSWLELYEKFRDAEAETPKKTKDKQAEA